MTVLPHEDIETHRLEHMPLSVRRKLVESATGLDDSDWRGLPRLARQRLVDVRVDTAVERRAFRQLIAWLRETFLGAVDGLQELPLHASFEHPWRSDEPPEGVSHELWVVLPVDLRYAVIIAPNHRDRTRIIDSFVR